MTTTQSTTAITFKAGEDLRNSQYSSLKIDNTGRVVKTTAATDVIVGMVSSNPIDSVDTTGNGVAVVTIGTGGISLGLAAAAINEGDFIVPSTTAGLVEGVATVAGLAIAQTAVGVAVSSTAAAGELVQFAAMTISPKA